MNITVLGETYDVSEPVGREYGELCAKGVNELTAAMIATSDLGEVQVKSVTVPTADPTIIALLDTIKSIIEQPGQAIHIAHQPPNVYVTNEAAKAPDVHVTTPEVNVLPAVVNVPKSEPVVNVAAPNVTVEPARVTVKADMPAMNVTVPATLAISSMPDRVNRRVVKRGKNGQITETTDVETDA